MGQSNGLKEHKSYIIVTNEFHAFQQVFGILNLIYQRFPTTTPGTKTDP